jgi:hypothetical protein
MHPPRCFETRHSHAAVHPCTLHRAQPHIMDLYAIWYTPTRCFEIWMVFMTFFFMRSHRRPRVQCPTPCTVAGVLLPTPDTWTVAANAKTPSALKSEPIKPDVRPRLLAAAQPPDATTAPCPLQSPWLLLHPVYMHLRSPRASDSVQQAQPARPR